MPEREWKGDSWNQENYGCHFKHLSQIAKMLKLPKDLIEGAVQQVLLKVMQQMQTSGGPDSLQRFQVLSGKIMHDTVVDLLRQRDQRRSVPWQDVPVEPVDGKANNPADRLAAKELPEWMGARLDELRQAKSHYAWLLDEHFLHQRPLEELASEKGVSKHAIVSQMTRAKEAFRRLLEKHDPDLEFLR